MEKEKVSFVQSKLVNRVQSLINTSSEENLEVLETVISALEKKINGSSTTVLANTLQFKSKMRDDGTYEMVMPINRLTKNYINTVHGGITATLIDTAMGTLVNETIAIDEGAVTAELKINYLKPGIGTSLTCIASPIHQGKKIHVCEAKVLGDNDQLIAHATGSFFIYKKEND
jgi:uncharacterized protein (TIGR00369 family)